MIDTQKPILDSTQVPPNANRITKTSRMFGAVLLIVIVFAAALVLWWFLRPTRTITLAEGESYVFAEFTVTLNRVSDNQCQEIQGVTCDETDKELGVQVSVWDAERNNTSFGYVAIDDEAPFETEGLRVTAEEVNLDDKFAKLRLRKL